MITLRTALLLLLLAARPLVAQGNTGEALDRAVRLFEDLQVERALALLRQVISPASPFEVTREQRARAFKYLGASMAIVGMRDSAIVYFRAALEREPFTDLDPALFTEPERSAFHEARLQLFAIGVRPLQRVRLDPAAERLAFAVVVTHQATLEAELRHIRTGTRIPLHQGSADGVRDLTWNGLAGDGRLAPPGSYEVVFSAASAHSGQSDSARLYFDLEHDRPALEDTLPSIRAEELLPERHPQSAAPLELVKGLGLAASALMLPSLVANGELDRGERKLVASVAAAAAVTGIVATIVRHNRREIDANIAENRRRVTEHEQANARIRARNEERLRATQLVITPAAGLPQ
ncbi:MAG TPA: hypothetical protein VMM18_13895 [Gemmatimonadaceae bacterium]|nr:hypothetical protein [Gemmatimonadaceae bacterium]